MVKIKNKFMGAFLLGIFSIVGFNTIVETKDVKVVNATTYPSESKSFRDASTKINHLIESLKTNYLGIKNQGTWQMYINETKDLIKKIPSKEKTKADLLRLQLDKSEALVNGLTRINQVEKSIQPKSEGGYGNYLGIKNAEVWNGYLNLAKIDLEKIDKGIFENQYNELINRMNKVNQIVKDIEDKFQVEYDKVVALKEEAISANSIDLAEIALSKAEKLGTCDRSNKLEKDIKEFIFTFNKNDYDSIINELKSYSKEYSVENSNNDGVFAIVHGQVKSDIKILNTFLESTKNGKPSEITVVQYTIEGDPIFIKVIYDGEKYYGVEDNSRDKFMGSYGEYRKFECKYLKIFDERNGRSQSAYLTNDEGLTLEKLRDEKYNGEYYLMYHFTK